MPEEVIGKGARLGEEIFKGWLLALLKAIRRTKAGIQIILKIGPEVNLIEWVPLVAIRLSGDLFYASIPLRFFERKIIKQRHTLF